MEASKNGLKKIAESRKGVFATLVGGAIAAIGVVKQVDPVTILQLLAYIGIGHSIGQGIADHGKK